MSPLFSLRVLLRRRVELEGGRELAVDVHLELRVLREAAVLVQVLRS